MREPPYTPEAVGNLIASGLIMGFILGFIVATLIWRLW